MAASQFADRYGRWAFIAGGSMGIGAALADEAARRGLHVVLLARGETVLRETAAGVAARHGVETRTVAADLARSDIGDVVAAATDDLEIGLFVYNATVAPAGRFVDTPLDVDLLSIAVNCTTPVILCKLLAPKMVERGRGGVALVGSMGGTQGAINFGTYNAGKAFEWILAETLWSELGDDGVDATCILVGATASENYLAFQATLDPELCGRADSEEPLDRARARLMAPNEPEQVARALYDQLGRGPVIYADGNDEYVSRRCFEMSRADSINVWRRLQETSTRTPERQAR